MSEAGSSDNEISNGQDLDEFDKKVLLPVGVDNSPSRLSVFNFEKMLEDYPCLAKYNPVLPTKDQRANRPPPGKVTLYQAYFTSSNLRLPLTPFYLKVLAHYKIGLAQMHPVGAGKILLFEMILAALRLPRSLSMFRMFFRLVTTGDWYTVQLRECGLSLITGAPSTIKFWRFDFFFVEATFIPTDKVALIEWRDVSNKMENTRINKKVNALPEKHLIDSKYFERIRKVSVPYRSYMQHEGILVLAKVSKDWEGDTVPILIKKSTKKPMSLLEGMGIDFDDFEIMARDGRTIRDEAGGLAAEGSQQQTLVSPPDRDVSKRLSFSSEQVANVGFDGSPTNSYGHQLPTEEVRDEVLAGFFDREASQPFRPYGDYSPLHDDAPQDANASGDRHVYIASDSPAPGEKRHGEDLVGSLRKHPRIVPSPTSNLAREKQSLEDEVKQLRSMLAERDARVKHVTSSSKKNKIKFLDAEEVLIPVEKAVAQQEIPRKSVANHRHTEGASGAETNHSEVTAVSKRLEAQEHQADEAIDLDDAFGDLDNDSNFAEIQNGSDRVIPNRDVTNEVPPRREFLEHVITPGRAQKIAKITNVELADKLEEIGGESLCFVSEGASRIRKLTGDVCLYRERLGKMENKAAKDAATIEQQAKTIGELTKLLTTSMENAREVRQKLEGEALESAAKLKELASKLKGRDSGDAMVSSDISDRDKVIAEKDKEIQSLKQKLVADETKDKEIAHLKEQLGDAKERENKLIKTQEALKKHHAQSVRSKDAALSSRRLVLSEVVPHVVKKLHQSHEYNTPLSKVKKLAVQLGRQQVIQEIQETKFPNIQLEDMEGYDGTIIGKFDEACKELEEADFPYIKEIAENTGRTVDDILKVEPKGLQSTHSEDA